VTRKKLEYVRTAAAILSACAAFTLLMFKLNVF
jgi:hypothetical protein